MSSNSSLSAGGVVLLVLLTLLGAWFFLPGLFDPDSQSLFASKNRRSPIANVAGPRTLIDQQITIREDQFQSFRIQLDMPSNVTVVANGVSGPEFDLFVMDTEGFSQWDRATDRLFGGEFTYYVKGNGKSVRRSVGLRPGTYVLVLDNTDFGEVAPPMNMNDDAVTVQVKLTAECAGDDHRRAAHEPDSASGKISARATMSAPVPQRGHLNESASDSIKESFAKTTLGASPR